MEGKGRTHLRQQVVGAYQLGSHMVQVVLREGDGGEYYVLPGDIPHPRIKVGADQGEWSDVVEVLLHEAMEQVMADLGYRWEPTNAVSRDRLGMMFMMAHPEFSEVCARVGLFLALCLPDVGVAWREWKKGAKG